TRIPLDPDAIRALADLLHETGLIEIEIAEKDSRVRVVRAAASVTEMPAPPVRPGMPRTVAAEPPPRQPSDDAGHPGAVLSPMVGIAYLLPEPGAPAFVSIGQEVSAGQTLLLIEAMKTFNQIKAPRGGTVSRILVSNGAPVEYGEALMIIES
ncbi:MAG: acetyl-CoA carboxylase biotin carboxyl carrier protein, partial [Acetobacteraceae bacterium]